MRCTKCKEYVPKGAFATYRGPNGEVRRRGICEECRGKYATEHSDELQAWRRGYNAKNRDKKRGRDVAVRAEAKAYVDAYKARPCADCGREWPPVAMDLDHVRGAKVKDVARMVGSGYKLDLIKIEVAKCDVVCACCHRLRTAARGENRAPNKATAKGDPHADAMPAACVASPAAFPAPPC